MLAQELLEVEFEEFLGAEPYERSEDREGYRNGYRERDLFTRVGRLTLRVPRDREGKFSTRLFDCYQRSEKALVLALQESYLQGVSTRKMKKITDCVACRAKTVRGGVLKRPGLPHGPRAGRNAGTLEDKTAREDLPLPDGGCQLRVCPGRRPGGDRRGADGQRYRPGGLQGDPERGCGPHGGGSYLTVCTHGGSSVFSDLIDRGLEPREIKYIVSDEHKGLKKALRRYFPKAVWQRCQTHYQRNAGSKVPHKAREEVHRELRDVFRAPGLEFAQHRASRMVTDYQSRFSSLANWLEESIHEPLAVFALPREHRKRLRTTNGLERYHGEVKRRTNVVRIFPNRASCLRLISALAMEQSEEWITGRRYLRMDSLKEKEIPVQQLEPIIPEVLPA